MRKLFLLALSAYFNERAANAWNRSVHGTITGKHLRHRVADRYLFVADELFKMSGYPETKVDWDK